jgi:hypothetical protein
MLHNNVEEVGGSSNLSETNGRLLETEEYLVPRVHICPVSVFASESCYADSPVTSEEPITKQIFHRGPCNMGHILTLGTKYAA